MTERRLFMGVIVMVVTKPGLHENHIEKFLGWAASEDAARGAWTKKAFAKHPGARMDGVSVDDITEIALQRLERKQENHVE